MNLCTLSLHRWEPWNPPEFARYRELGYEMVRSRRCPRCEKSQVIMRWRTPS